MLVGDPDRGTVDGDPGRAGAMGLAGRKRAVAEFSWDAVAAQTAALYADLVAGT